MSINHLYDIWYKRIEQLRPGERVTRLRNLAWLLAGICRSKSVHLSQVALKIPGDAKTLSIVWRLSRFLDNPAIRVREWYEPVARNVLQAMADSVGEIRLIADGTKVGFGHQLLMVAVAFTDSPSTFPVSALKPEGISRARIGAWCLFIARMASAHTPFTSRSRRVPNNASTITSVRGGRPA